MDAVEYYSFQSIPEEILSFVAQSFRDLVFHFDWSQSEPLHSTLCIPAAALSLAVCLALGYPATGVMMASGAMCVGFGSFQKPLFTRSGR